MTSVQLVIAGLALLALCFTAFSVTGTIDRMKGSTKHKIIFNSLGAFGFFASMFCFASALVIAFFGEF